MSDETHPDIDVLSYYDGPLSYAERTSDGRILYHHWIDEEAGGWVYAVVAITAEELASLKAGSIDVRGLFDGRPAWRRADDGGCDGALEPWEVDDAVLPERGVTLYPPGA